MNGARTVASGQEAPSTRGSQRGTSRESRGAQLLFCLGLALVFGSEWSNRTLIRQAMGQSWSAVLLWEALTVIAFASYALFYRRTECLASWPRARQRVCLVLLGALASTGRALYVVPPEGSAPAWLAIGGVVAHALSEPALVLAYLVACCRRDHRRAGVLLPSTFVIAGLGMIALNGLGTLAIDVFAIASPLAGAVIYAACLRPKEAEGQAAPDGSGAVAARGNEGSSAGPARQAGLSRPVLGVPSIWPYALMLTYDFAYHAITSIDHASSVYGVLGLVVVSAIALVVALVRRGSYSPLFLYKLALPVVVAALMCLTIPGPGQSIAAMLSDTGSAAFYQFLIITFIAMCRRHELDAVRSFSLLLAFEHAGHLLGGLTGTAFVATFPHGGPELQVVVTLMAVTTIVLSTVLFNDIEVSRLFGLVPRTTTARLPRTGQAPARTVLSEHEMVAWQCAKASREFSLTIREEEVLELMMSGEDIARMAESLTVSPGTIKTHVSHVCRKLGAGSRDEAVRIARSL